MRIRNKFAVIALAPAELALQLALGIWAGLRETTDSVRDAWKESTWL